jgi:hypothetical protein
MNMSFDNTPEATPNSPSDGRNPQQISRAQDGVPLDNTKSLYGNITNWSDESISVVSDAKIQQVPRGQSMGDADAIVMERGVTYNVLDSGATSRPEIDVAPRILGSFEGSGINCLKFGDATNVIITQESPTQVNVRLSGPVQEVSLHRDVEQTF